MSNSTRNAAETGRQPPNNSPRKRTALFAGVLLFGLVTGNSYVQAGLTWENVQWSFRSAEAANWHPVTWLSHMLDCELFGLAPWGHHLTNVLFHAINAALVFALLQQMTGSP